MTPRSTIRWDSEHDADLIADLDRYKARCRGRRLKDLALLGLWAESKGFRALVEALAPLSPEAPQALVEEAPESKPSANGISNDHQMGIDALLEGFGIE